MIIWQNFQIIVNFQISRLIAELFKTEEIKKHTKKSTVKEQEYPKMTNRFGLNRERLNTNKVNGFFLHLPLVNAPNM